MRDDKYSMNIIILKQNSIYCACNEVLLAVNIDAGGGPETRMSLGVA